MRNVPYDRKRAVAYAHQWAYDHNPKYGVFEDWGGDCTNFASQVLFAGSRVMNVGPSGWYYKNMDDRAPAWSGVVQLHEFLTHNKGVGPYAEEVSPDKIEVGDLIQLRFVAGDRFRHTPVVVKVGEPGRLDQILVAAHTFNTDNRPLSTYVFSEARFLHILGVRK